MVSSMVSSPSTSRLSTARSVSRIGDSRSPEYTGANHRLPGIGAGYKVQRKLLIAKCAIVSGKERRLGSHHDLLQGWRRSNSQVKVWN